MPGKIGEFIEHGGFILVKNLLVLINFLCLLGGILMMSYGMNISYAGGDVFVIKSAATAGIVIGVITTLVSLLGCLGATNEKGVLLRVYFVMLLLLVILQIICGSIAAAQKDQFPELATNAWADFYKNDQASITAIQKRLKCCGFKSVEDRPVPANCTATYPEYNNKSCYVSLVDSFQSHLGSLAGAGIALGLIELIGLTFSVVLFRKLATKQSMNNAVLSENWRINTNRIHHGYGHYAQTN